MKNIIIIAVIILSGCAGWTKTQKTLLGYDAALHVFDMYCTYHYVGDDHEMNSILDGMKPAEAVLTMAATFGIMYLIADSFPKLRMPVLIGYGAVKTGITINNIKYGIP